MNAAIDNISTTIALHSLYSRDEWSVSAQLVDGKKAVVAVSLADEPCQLVRKNLRRHIEDHGLAAVEVTPFKMVFGVAA